MAVSEKRQASALVGDTDLGGYSRRRKSLGVIVAKGPANSHCQPPDLLFTNARPMCRTDDGFTNRFS